MAYKEIVLTPAYGRDCKSKAAVLTDRDADKDFHTNFGYVNKQQVAELKADGFTHLHFRYKRLTVLAVLEIK